MNGEFEFLKKIIVEKIGFYPDRYKRRPLKRRIAVRMRYNKVNSYLEYAKILEKDKNEQRFLHKTLTINVSKFFRNFETFRKIEEEVLPQLLLEYEKKGKILKVWCAGCATGEECYTIGMLMDRFLRGRQPSVPFIIIGTDIDNDSLDMAEVGCYRNNVLDETPEYYLKTYFLKNERFCVSDRIKEKVRFIKLDIEQENVELKELDLVLFRNVLIYMEKSFQKKILLMIHNRLKDEAFLVLGKVETLIGDTKSLFNIVDSRERIFSKCQILKR